MTTEPAPGRINRSGAAPPSASGYGTVDWLGDWPASVAPGPIALAAAAADQSVRDLRQQAMPILLDLEQDGEARAACLCSGADDFWLSGVRPSDLLRLRLHRTIQARRSGPPLCWRISALTPRPVGGGPAADRADGEEFLLFVLIKRPGKVFSPSNCCRRCGRRNGQQQRVEVCALSPETGVERESVCC